jgi:hypothetical protein
LKKSSTYEEDFSFVGHGTIHLGVVDKNGRLIKNGNFVSGDITKHYPYTTGSDRVMAISYMDDSDVKLGVIPVLWALFFPLHLYKIQIVTFLLETNDFAFYVICNHAKFISANIKRK